MSVELALAFLRAFKAQIEMSLDSWKDVILFLFFHLDMLSTPDDQWISGSSLVYFLGFSVSTTVGPTSYRPCTHRPSSHLIFFNANTYYNVCR